MLGHWSTEVLVEVLRQVLHVGGVLEHEVLTVLGQMLYARALE